MEGVENEPGTTFWNRKQGSSDRLGWRAGVGVGWGGEGVQIKWIMSWLEGAYVGEIWNSDELR